MLTHASGRKKPVNIPRIHHTEGAPVAWFLMQRPGGTFPGDAGDVANLTGRSQSLLRESACAFVPGPFGSELAFHQSSSDYATGAAPISMTLTEVLTFAFTARFRTLAGGNFPRVIDLVSGGHEIQIVSDSAHGNIWLTRDSRYNPGVDGVGFGATVPGPYYRVVASFDGPNSTTSFWVDGGPQAGSYLGSSIGDGGGASQLTLGVRSDLNATSYLDGAISDLQIYTRALSPAEIARDYADPYWRLRPRRRRRLFSFAPDPPAAGTGGAILRRQRRQRLKPPNIPRLHRTFGAPASWYLLQRPGKTFTADTGDVPDITRNAPAATRSGGCTFAAGPTGGALAFDGSGAASLPALFSSTSAFTVALTFALSAAPGVAVLLGDGSNLYLRIQTGPLRIDFCGFAANSGITVGPTYEIAITFDGAGGLAAYLNGQLYHTQTGVSFGGSFGSTWYLGAYGGGGFLGITGSISNFRVFSRVLSAGEIAREYADPFWRLRSERVLAAASAGATNAGAASLAGLSTLTAAAALAIPGAASLAAVSTLTATASLAIPGAASLAGLSTLTAAAGTAYAGAASLAAVSTLTATASLAIPGAASLTGLSTLTASTTDTVFGAASLGGVSTLTATATFRYAGSAGLSAVSTLTAASTLTLAASAALAGRSSLVAAATGGSTPTQPDASRATATRIGPDPSKATASRA